jgi:hypothetical protein
MSFYLINHSAKEFCTFDNGIPILTAFKQALRANNWQSTDDICVDYEDTNSFDLLNHLVNALVYINMDDFENARLEVLFPANG